MLALGEAAELMEGRARHRPKTNTVNVRRPIDHVNVSNDVVRPVRNPHSLNNKLYTHRDVFDPKNNTITTEEIPPQNRGKSSRSIDQEQESVDQAASAKAKEGNSLSNGTGMAVHGATGLIGTAVSTGGQVKMQKIKQETAETVSANALKGVEDTNRTNQDIATMQNNASLTTNMVHSNAAANVPENAPKTDDK